MESEFELAVPFACARADVTFRVARVCDSTALAPPLARSRSCAVSMLVSGVRKRLVFWPIIGRQQGAESCGIGPSAPLGCAAAVARARTVTHRRRRAAMPAEGLPVFAPVDPPRDAAIELKTEYGAPRDGVRSALNLLQMIEPRCGDPLPLGSVPLSPNIASASRFHDVAHRGRVYVPAAVAVQPAGAQAVAAGDSGRGEAL